MRSRIFGAIFCVILCCNNANSEALAYIPYINVGVQGGGNINDSKSQHLAALSAFGAHAKWDSPYFGFSEIALGGWLVAPILDYPKSSPNRAYKSIFVLSDAMFAIGMSKILNIKFGRYDTKEMEYEWFSGHNEGVAIESNLFDIARIWGFYSFRQAFEFKKDYRENYGQMNALWDFGKHKSFRTDEFGSISSNNKGHLFAGGIDFYANFGENLGSLRISPYIYYALDSILASGVSIDLGFKYSNSVLKYVYANENTSSDGHLILFEQEFGGSFATPRGLYLGGGGGYYKSINNGIGRLGDFGDRARFYGGVVSANANNRAAGEYFRKEQSTFYAFLNLAYKNAKLDILYADGDYGEISAIFTYEWIHGYEYRHNEPMLTTLGVGYVNLDKIAGKRRDYVNCFVAFKLPSGFGKYAF